MTHRLGLVSRPYVSERAWGTVREDYSASGDAWNYFPHDQARSRAYRWNEDGLAAVCNRFQVGEGLHAPKWSQHGGVGVVLTGFSSVQQSSEPVHWHISMEPCRPYPQGAAIWTHWLRGQPRRGCERVLLLPRQVHSCMSQELTPPLAALSHTHTYVRLFGHSAALLHTPT